MADYVFEHAFTPVKLASVTEAFESDSHQRGPVGVGPTLEPVVSGLVAVLGETLARRGSPAAHSSSRESAACASNGDRAAAH